MVDKRERFTYWLEGWLDAIEAVEKAQDLNKVLKEKVKEAARADDTPFPPLIPPLNIPVYRDAIGEWQAAVPAKKATG
jgi:hypothetical protein